MVILFLSYYVLGFCRCYGILLFYFADAGTDVDLLCAWTDLRDTMTDLRPPVDISLVTDRVRAQDRHQLVMGVTVTTAGEVADGTLKEGTLAEGTKVVDLDKCR